MKQIKITYRAIFEQPTGKLNPMGCPFKGLFPVEVFGSGEKWRIRELSSARREEFKILGKWPSPGAAQQTAAANFKRQVTEWEIWGDPTGKDERPLDPSEIHQADGKTYFRTPEDYSHILHAPAIDTAAKVPPAACGAKVPAAAFINNRANIEPTCKACAQVWREHYRGAIRG